MKLVVTRLSFSRGFRDEGSSEFARCAQHSFDDGVDSASPASEHDFHAIKSEAAALRGRGQSRSVELRSIAGVLHAAAPVCPPQGELSKFVKRRDAGEVEAQCPASTETPEPAAPQPRNYHEDPRPIALEWLGKRVEELHFLTSLQCRGEANVTPRASRLSPELCEPMSPLSAYCLSDDDDDGGDGRSMSDGSDQSSNGLGGDHTLATPMLRFVGNRGGLTLDHSLALSLASSPEGNQNEEELPGLTLCDSCCSSEGSSSSVGPSPAPTENEPSDVLSDESGDELHHEEPVAEKKQADMQKDEESTTTHMIRDDAKRRIQVKMRAAAAAAARPAGEQLDAKPASAAGLGLLVRRCTGSTL